MNVLIIVLRIICIGFSCFAAFVRTATLFDREVSVTAKVVNYIGALESLTTVGLLVYLITLIL